GNKFCAASCGKSNPLRLKNLDLRPVKKVCLIRCLTRVCSLIPLLHGSNIPVSTIPQFWQ
ncbi:MAG: hypothetical protein AAB385_06425, partial [Planctomycetota bacterium]